MTESAKWLTLTDGERIVLQSHPSIITRLDTIITGLVAILGGLVSLLYELSILSLPILDNALPAGTGVLLCLMGIFVIALTTLQWKSIHFVITTEEVYIKTRILGRDVSNTNLRNIYNTNYEQTAIERALGVGTVHIQTAGTGGTDIRFDGIKSPKQVVETIVKLRDGQ